MFCLSHCNRGACESKDTTTHHKQEKGKTMEDPSKVPHTLKHKPVVVVNDYAALDGRHAGNTDTRGLSIGLAQWSDRRNYRELSAKVWRYTGEKWSRQSEELPLHRVLDLAILICSSKHFFAERYRKTTEEHLKAPRIGHIALQGQAMNVELCTENNRIADDIEIFDEQLRKDDEFLSERLRRLAAALKELGY